MAVLSDGFGGKGGIAKFNRDLIRATCLQDSTEDLIILQRIQSERFTGELPPCARFGLNSARGKLHFVIHALKAALTNRVDTVICGHINLTLIAYACKLLTCSKFVLFIHGIDAWGSHPNRLIRIFVKKAHHVVAVSSHTAALFASWSAINMERISILPNCVDLSLYSPGQKDELLTRKYGLKTRKVVMTMGRLAESERYKGFDEVMEILPLLLDDYPDLAYLIVGDGSDRGRLEEKAQELGLKDHVIFTGHIEEEAKGNYLRLADVFAMPGSGEGFGIVYLEALACGIPVIGSRIDGSREALMNGKLGKLVDPSEPLEIAAAIREALLNTRREVQKELLEFSFDRFTHNWESIVRNFSS